jgi:hypothetical protein
LDCYNLFVSIDYSIKDSGAVDEYRPALRTQEACRQSGLREIILLRNGKSMKYFSSNKSPCLYSFLLSPTRELSHADQMHVPLVALLFMYNFKVILRPCC